MLKPSETELLQRTRDTDPMANALTRLSNATVSATPKTDVQRLLAKSQNALTKAVFSTDEQMMKKLLTESMSDPPAYTQLAWLQNIGQLEAVKRQAIEFKISCCSRIITGDSAPAELQDLQRMITDRHDDVEEILTLKREAASLISNPNDPKWKENFAKADEKHVRILDLLARDQGLTEAVASAELLEDLKITPTALIPANIQATMGAQKEIYIKKNAEIIARLGSKFDKSMNAKVSIGSGDIEVGGYIGLKMLQLQIEAHKDIPSTVDPTRARRDAMGQSTAPIVGIENVTLRAAFGDKISDFKGFFPWSGLRPIGKDVKWDVWQNRSEFRQGDNQSGITVGYPPSVLFTLGRVSPDDSAARYHPAVGDWNKCHVAYFGTVRTTPDLFKSKKAEGDKAIRDEIARFINDPDRKFLEVCLVESYPFNLAPWMIYLSKKDVKTALGLK